MKRKHRIVDVFTGRRMQEDARIPGSAKPPLSVEAAGWVPAGASPIERRLGEIEP